MNAEVETESQRQIRAHMEMKRDRAAEYMRFEHAEMEKVCADSRMLPVTRLAAANNFARVLAAYMFARKELELCGWDAGEWPQWYREITQPETTSATPADRVCGDCARKHWGRSARCEPCRDVAQREARL